MGYGSGASGEVNRHTSEVRPVSSLDRQGFRKLTSGAGWRWAALRLTANDQAHPARQFGTSCSDRRLRSSPAGPGSL